jgi:type I restriction enzyme M protein
MIAKMKPPDVGGSRLSIVFNGSPLFTGAAGSGESEIRRWIIENDWLEAVVALPDQLFYNTGISTYFWVVTNRKSPARKGKVQLVDAREYFVKMRKSMGEKRKEISTEQIVEITRLYGEFTEGEQVKIFPNEAFGHLRITVDRPLRLRWEVTEETIAAVDAAKPVEKLDPLMRRELRQRLTEHLGVTTTNEREMAKNLERGLAQLQVPGAAEKAVFGSLAVQDERAPAVTDRKGNPIPDPDLRENENVPLPAVEFSFLPDPTERLSRPEFLSAVSEYMKAEVLPYVPDAWVDTDKTRIGYEIPVTRHFYKYIPPRPLAEIDAEINALESEIELLLAKVAE